MEGINHQASKVHNKLLLLKYVTMNGPVSRLELHRISGLSKMTITNLVVEFLAEGIFQTKPCPSERRAVGRRVELIDVVPGAMLSVGIHIAHDHMQVGIINLKGEILRSEQTTLSTEDDSRAFTDKLFTLLKAVMSDRYRKNLKGVGISSMSPLSISEGKILKHWHFQKIPQIDIVAPLRDWFNNKIPVYLENDVNVSALAELYYGQGRNYGDFIYFHVSTGIGAAIIINNELFRGVHGNAGELGHIALFPDGIACGCGNRGCLERYASIPSILEWYGARTGTPVQDTMSDWRALVFKAKNGDADCLAAIRRMGDFLAVGLTSIVNIVDPNCIFLGGGFASASDLLIPHISETLNSRKFPSRDEIRMVMSNYSDISRFIGTAALVLENNIKTNRCF